jgi:hypothetical protein
VRGRAKRSRRKRLRGIRIESARYGRGGDAWVDVTPQVRGLLTGDTIVFRVISRLRSMSTRFPAE